MIIDANVLTKLRKEKGITQKQIAEIIGITERNYRHYEAGELDPLTSTTKSLAEYFGVSIDYLVGRTDNPEVNR